MRAASALPAASPRRLAVQVREARQRPQEATCLPVALLHERQRSEPEATRPPRLRSRRQWSYRTRLSRAPEMYRGCGSSRERRHQKSVPHSPTHIVEATRIRPHRGHSRKLARARDVCRCTVALHIRSVRRTRSSSSPRGLVARTHRSKADLRHGTALRTFTDARARRGPGRRESRCGRDLHHVQEGAASDR